MLRFRYGADRCKILCESPWIAPERTLSSGYHFRFGTLESALPHLLQNRPGLLRIVFDYFLWLYGVFKEFLRTQYYHQRMEAENNAIGIIKISLILLPLHIYLIIIQISWAPTLPIKFKCILSKWMGPNDAQNKLLINIKAGKVCNIIV